GGESAVPERRGARAKQNGGFRWFYYPPMPRQTSAPVWSLRTQQTKAIGSFRPAFSGFLTWLAMRPSGLSVAGTNPVAASGQRFRLDHASVPCAGRSVATKANVIPLSP